MKLVSRIALGVALSLGATSLVATAPAAAQKKKQEAAEQADKAGERKLELSKEEREALRPLSAAVDAKDWAAATAALPAAQAAAQGADARYALGSLQLQVALGTNNVQMQAQAIDAMIASGGVPAADLPSFYKNQGALALNLGDNAKAEAAYTKWVELAPNDPNAAIALGAVKRDLKKMQEAVPLFERAITLQQAANQPVPESWYKIAFASAFDNKMGPQAAKFSRQLLAAYPTQTNWRDALLIYRETNRLDDAMNLDLMRLMRATKALNGERDYYELADALSQKGLPGETKAVLDEGAAAGAIDPKKAMFSSLISNAAGRISEDKASLAGLATKAMAASAGKPALDTADAYFGYGDYAKAIPLYRAALQKGSVDANLVNTRLGMALALSGQKAEAETAFRAITGPRADLAAYWLLWLDQRA